MTEQTTVQSKKLTHNRVYETEIVGQYAMWLIEKLVDNDPLMKQSADLALECKDFVELKFSMN